MPENLFIDVEVTPEAAADTALAAKLTEVCPVDIYGQHGDGTLMIRQANLDECVLCRLCLDASPKGAVTVRKLYDGGAAL
jgi:NAD-dependent dihydropyrimidine dehydrogenase PreA subunit